MEILVLNSGSSSQKACLYEIGETVPDHPPVPLWQGKIEWSGHRSDPCKKLTGCHLQRGIADLLARAGAGKHSSGDNERECCPERLLPTRRESGKRIGH
jgi:hypothetical protein